MPTPKPNYVPRSICLPGEKGNRPAQKARGVARCSFLSLLGVVGCVLIGCLIRGVGPLPEALALQASRGVLELTVSDPDTGQPVPCRIHLRRSKGRPWKPEGVPFGHDYFIFPGRISLKMPLGTYEFEIERGPEYAVRSGYFTIQRDSNDTQQVELPRFVNMPAEGWYGGDLLVCRGPDQIELLLEAEDLYVVPWVGPVGNRGSSSSSSPSSEAPAGHLGRSQVKDASARVSEKGALSPVRRFHRQAMLVENPGGSYVLVPLTSEVPWGKLSLPKEKLSHATDQAAESSSAEFLLDILEGEGPSEAGTAQPPRIWMDVVWPYSWDLPMWLALGKVDSIQVLHSHFRRTEWIDQEKEGRPRDKARFPGRWGHGLWGEYIYFQVLESGLRIPPSAGSGAGWAPNPLGYNRVYVHADGALSWPDWWKNLQNGRVVVTNGPLLRPKVRGKLPGHEFTASAGEKVVLDLSLTFSTRERVQYLEIIQNGRVAHSISFEEYRKSGQLPKIVFEQSGWFLVRAVAESPPTYRFAMTGPYYVTIGQSPRISRSAVKFFLDWIQERRTFLEKGDEKPSPRLLRAYHTAQKFWEDQLRRANAD